MLSTTSLDQAELYELRAAELVRLEAAFSDQLRHSEQDSQLTIHLTTTLIHLAIILAPTYPLTAPTVELEYSPSWAIPKADAFELERRLRDVARSNQLEEKSKCNPGSAERICRMVNEACREWYDFDFDSPANSWICSCRDCAHETTDAGINSLTLATASERTTRRFLNACLFPTYSLSHLARFFPPHSLGSAYPYPTTILHWEPVARAHLIDRFKAKREHLRTLATAAITKNKGARATQERIIAWTKTEIVFCRVARSDVETVLRDGFEVPGTHTWQGLDWDSGSGLRVQTNPVDFISLKTRTEAAFTDRPIIPGHKVIVAAALRGRWKYCYDPLMDFIQPNREFDSHLQGDEHWTVFDSAQVVPLVLLHVGTQHDLSFMKRVIPKLVDRRGKEEGEDHAARTRRLQALASKSLPFGFGPDGTAFVVEDVGEVEADEDDFGEWRTATPRGQYAWRLDEFA